ncbi:ribonuclease J [Novosphingobium sp.]|uniref:ribonuclease J n=1 Tax=Novosphingobium sp. TaxID=1874826 RepID=UPI0025F8D97D|nr:ribonuclease J [Novosphingobium sp.]
MTPGNELLFLALGGSGEIGMNVNLYGCDGKWLMVDLGMTFADPYYPGIDLVFADLEFIEERAKDLVGVVLTHGHEDHIGAVPYFAAELGVPLYATPFTAKLVAEKLKEAGLTNDVELRVIDHEDPFWLGPFGIRYVPLAHSIAEGNALVIDTPYGRVFHTGDWKLDDEPIIGVPATAEELTELGDSGVLALVCDSTNVFNAKPSGSEGAVRDGLLETVGGLTGRVVVTTFASNVARLQTLGEVAVATGRQLCVAGRSLDRIIGVAKSCGYLKDFPDTIDPDSAMRLPRREVMVLATGGQGESRAALARISGGSHPIKLEAGDAVVFSSRQIPGNELAIGRIQNQLAFKGVSIVTDRQSMIHVSGHPGRPELEALYRWIRPEMLVPVHGEIRHMAEQARVGQAAGIPRTIVQKNGDLIRLAPNGPHKLGEEVNGRLVLDGEVIAPADGAAMVARRKLAENGLVTVALAVSLEGKLKSQVEVAAIGIPLEDDLADFVAEAQVDVADAVSALKGDKKRDRRAVAEAVRLAGRRAAQRWSGKKPVVQVLLREG